MEDERFGGSDGAMGHVNRGESPGGSSQAGAERIRLLWPEGPPAPELAPDTVTVHAFPLDAPVGRVAAAAALLTAEERARAGRLVTEALRTRFLVSQGALRRILASYTGVEAERLRFEYGPHGKPSLAHGTSEPSDQAPRVHFNLSHSAGLGLLAVSGSFSSIGIDVEQIERRVDLEPLARRCFTGEEYEGFRTLLGEERSRGFFLGWTRKEAFMKATGEGLSRPLDSFEVELRPSAAPDFLRLPDAERPGAWTLKHLVPAHNFVGALAVRSSGAAVSVRTWSWPLDLP